MIIVIPFLQIGKPDSANLGKNRNGVVNYYKSIYVCAWSILKFNPSIKIVLVTNKDFPRIWNSLFTGLGVEVAQVPFRRNLTGDLFQSSLYYLDVIQWLSNKNDYLLLDPDVLCVGSLSGIARGSDKEIAALPLNYRPAERFNGSSREELAKLARAAGRIGTRTPLAYGGEFYYFPGERVDSIQGGLLELGELLNSESALAHRDAFRTEEHHLSFALATENVVDATPWVKRIWTTRRYRNVTGIERDLALWHLPAEKNLGFLALFEALIADEQRWQAMSRDDFMQFSGELMGLWNRKLVRYAKESLLGTAGRVFPPVSPGA